MKLITSLLVLLTFINNAEAKSSCSSLGNISSTKLTGELLEVLDGDTIKVVISSKVYNVRLLGIDTPELHFMGKQQKHGQEASDTLKQLLKYTSTVTIETESQPCDKFDRMLGHVFVEGVNVNKKMLSLGMAVNYCIQPNTKRCEEYGNAVAPFIQSGEGIFDEDFIEPYVWRRKTSNQSMDKKVMDSRTGIIYQPRDYLKVPIQHRIFIFND